MNHVGGNLAVMKEVKMGCGGLKVSGGGLRVEITWPIVYR